MEIFTLGHSNRTLQYVVDLLLGYGIECLVDIRTIPRSRHNPQFNGDTLPRDLKPLGIDYVHMPHLGGLRRPRPDSKNTRWINSSFRGYADYMQTPEFASAIDELIARARRQTVAYMCAEAVPWRCHRSLVSDALTVRGISVYDIMSRVTASAHTLTPFARALGTQLIYDGEQQKHNKEALRSKSLESE